jgi:hypothetical protein
MYGFIIIKSGVLIVDRTVQMKRTAGAEIFKIPRGYKFLNKDGMIILRAIRQTFFLSFFFFEGTIKQILKPQYKLEGTRIKEEREKKGKFLLI